MKYKFVLATHNPGKLAEMGRSCPVWVWKW